VVVFDIRFCLDATETKGSGFGNWTVQFGGCRELVPASVLATIFTPGTLFFSAATSYGPLSALGFALSTTKVLLLGPIC
jgi:hypothetical protein